MTPRQADFMRALASYQDAHEGLSPSYEEMTIILGLHSKSGIQRMVDSLEQDGYVRRVPHKARNVEILRMPGGQTNAAARITTAELVAELRRRGYEARRIAKLTQDVEE